MHNFSFLTCLEIAQSLWHLRDLTCMALHFSYVYLYSSTNCKLFKGYDSYIVGPVSSHLSGKDSMDSIDPPYILAIKEETASLIVPSLLKRMISREQPEIWVCWVAEEA